MEPADDFTASAVDRDFDGPANSAFGMMVTLIVLTTIGAWGAPWAYVNARAMEAMEFAGWYGLLIPAVFLCKSILRHMLVDQLWVNLSRSRWLPRSEAADGQAWPIRPLRANGCS